ncbi:unnamed protein product [Heterobilharzia americana]|nr:unnamed protein product [Heterobilharzia americana]
MSANVFVSFFSASGGIPSGPAAFSYFSSLMSFRTSTFVERLVFTCSSAVAGGISGQVSDGGRFKSFSKWSPHRFLCFSSLVAGFPSLSFIGFICVNLFPDSNLVI